MVDDVRALLAHGCADMGVIPPPTGLPDRQRRAARRQGALAVLTAVIVVAAVAGGATLLHGSDHRETTRSNAALPSQPTPQGVTATQLTRYRWHDLPPAPIAARTDAAAVWTGRQLVIWGGQAGAHVLADGAVYDPQLRHWTRLPPAPLSARVVPNAVYVAGSMIVWGGGTFSDGARYDIATHRWSRLPPLDDRSPATSSALAVVGDDAYLTRGHGSSVRLDRYSRADNRWTSLPSLHVAAKHTIQQVDALGLTGALLVWNEWEHTVHISPQETSTSSGAEAWRFDVSAKKWESSPTEPDRGLSTGGAVLVAGRVLLPQDGGSCFHCSGPAFTQVPSVLIDPRTGSRLHLATTPAELGHGFVSTGAALLALNRGTEMSGANGTRPGDLAVWDPRTRRWTRLPPDPRRPNDYPTVVWAGDRLLVWGDGAAGQEFASDR